ncbi:MAG TPA: DeoR/GlpR family DNA-binding transcription regulator [Ktedonobacteraceae bacterium]|nr:DeoR/GlpR family DNA-binding transcription regulator [Ktedonobacteraceae bacterium]
MLASERRRLILERVAEHQSIEALALADELGVSVMTVRRDIKRLEQDGFLRQTYGGATVHITKSVELGFTSRALQYSAQKRLIGVFASQMIEPGQTLFLGEGTTTSQFAQFLPPHPLLQVITASLSHASLLCSRGIRVIVLGGKLHSDELIMTGPIAETTINRFYADACILGAAGVDPQVGVTELDYEVASLHRLMMERSRRVIVLADHSKLGFRAPAVVAPAAMVTTLVTDNAAASEMLDQLQACGMQIALAGERSLEPEARMVK